jgi:hypothetical protein
MPTKSIPQLGDPNWGTPLNAHLSQLQNPTNGGINTFEQFSQRPTNLTTDDIGIPFSPTTLPTPLID